MKSDNKQISSGVLTGAITGGIVGVLSSRGYSLVEIILISTIVGVCVGLTISFVTRTSKPSSED